ncbi:hypothetical protein [Aquimarina algicola]|uniref:Uncharacterized protein n=1 Tax=Aquimarina algicola TaxID=2589995 RepID=A0A504J362_9FLAO|nr:hypothetical protein [Aquimarina algicola]TPN85386.1 hypothetical protein FHK87_15335 [Aquimarina algicola]
MSVLFLRLKMVNNFLDDRFEGLIRKVFDDAVQNESMDLIHERIESAFEQYKTELVITIETCFSGVFLSRYDIAEHIDRYFKNHLEYGIKAYFKQTDLPFDWLYDKEKETYVWHEDVTSANDPDLPSDHEYVGKSMKDIKAHFDANTSWLDKVRDFVGSGGSRIRTDIGSYIGAKLKPKIENAILSQRDAYHARYYEKTRSTDHFYPKSFHIASVERSTSRFGAGIGNYFFDTIIVINNISIPIRGTYVARNESNSMVNSLDFMGNYATATGSSYTNAIHFEGENTVLIVEVISAEHYRLINNFIYDK